MKFAKKFLSKPDYQRYLGSENFIIPNVSLCADNRETYCTSPLGVTKKIGASSTTSAPVANFLDILYSDSNGNLSFTSEVLSVSEGKTPIGLCIAPTGFFGENEPARWMSLQYMSCTTPETGTIDLDEYICLGGYDSETGVGTNVLTIDDIQITYNGGIAWGTYTADWINDSDNKIPSLFTNNNEWNVSILGTVNQYATTDIDGKSKTAKFAATVTEQPNWQTDTEIENIGERGYSPAVCCCLRYHTLGTQAGDWYLGAAGEMSIIAERVDDINNKIGDLLEEYYTSDINILSQFDKEEIAFWTSTEYNIMKVYDVHIDFETSEGYLTYTYKDESYNVLALLQY